MIRLSKLTKRFGRRLAVDGISLFVERGEIFSFLGPNGAGKTTTIRMLAGILKPSGGAIEIGGFDLLREPEKAKRITGYIPDRPHVYEGLTGREFLYFISELYSLDTETVDKRIDELLDRHGIREWEEELVESYSHGMRQRLVTCAALLHDPLVLIIDEPMVGLDPRGAIVLKRSLREYAKAGMAIFLSTHSLNVAQELSDRIAIIDRGRIIGSGSMDELRSAANDDHADLEKLFLEFTSDSDPASTP